MYLAPIQENGDPSFFQAAWRFEFMPRQLHECIELNDLASIFGLSYRELVPIIYPKNSNYRCFEIPKRSGGNRTICAPKKRLKRIQSMLYKELVKYYQPRQSTHGFIAGRSIKSNALNHVNKKFILNVDLKDFFGSIHFGRVLRLFKSKPFHLNHEIATVLAQICCFENKLPQGAPTSPIITNMICKKLDHQLQDLAKKSASNYSRYADDITFSFTCPKLSISKNIIQDPSTTPPLLGESLIQIIKSNGFEINWNKIRLRSNRERQRVTGIVVNQKCNVSSDYIRKTKSMLYAWERFGAENAGNHFFHQYSQNTRQSEFVILSQNIGSYFIQIVSGRIAHITMVRGKSDWVSRILLFKLSKLLGKPKQYLLYTKEKIAYDSIYIIDNLQTIEQGTGFLLHEVGLVTNQHVVRHIDDSNTNQLEIYKFDDLQKYYRQIYPISSFPAKDTAILTPGNEFKDTYAIRHICTDIPEIKQEVIIIGFPNFSQGQRPKTIRTKVIDTHTLFGKPMYQVEEHLEHGISGSPVFNLDWELIGIATFGSKETEIATKCNGFIPIQFALNLL